MNFITLFLGLCVLVSVCVCELSEEKKDNLLNSFIDYYNNLPDQEFVCDGGLLKNARQIDDHSYNIEVSLKVANGHNEEAAKILICSANVRDQDNTFTAEGVDCTPQNADEQLKDNVPTANVEPQVEQIEVTEPVLERKPVQLDNEIQANTAVTSGEQFIAVPREHPANPCVGCASHVNPQAAGVSELANLGVRHLDRHEPNVKHHLNSVLDVERQVQVVNGVRYILTLLIDFNNCSESQTESCTSTNACKISILVKPWVKLPNGSKYRAILSNNCTEEWFYGDNGELLPEDSTDYRNNNQIDGSPTKNPDHEVNSDEHLTVIHRPDIESQPNQGSALSEDEIKNIEAQIIPNDHFVSTTTKVNDLEPTSPNVVNNQHDAEEITKRREANLASAVKESNQETKPEPAHNLNEDKMKAIDDMLDFFNFSGYEHNPNHQEDLSRTKRSYESDLKVLSTAEKYKEIKNRLEKAKFIYGLAQTMVNYLNDQDITTQNRILNEVLNAEEETENQNRFIYLQCRVIIPCDKVDCGTKESIMKICNGIIDSTNSDNPQVLAAFCHDDYKGKNDKTIHVPTNDPVLKIKAEAVVKKMESDLSDEQAHAIRINKILGATTRQGSGVLTKISMMIEFINCNTSISISLRHNCPVIKQLGSKICEVLVLEREWLKDQKISYTCTDIPIDVTFSPSEPIEDINAITDPKIVEMLQAALENLEIQSNRNNKQKIVKVQSVTTEILAGFLIKIDFLVGYTTCTNDNVLNQQQTSDCELLPNERLRACVAEIWDRAWMEDSKQMEISCNDKAKNNAKYRKRRSTDQLIGGPMAHDIDDPKYKGLAEESLSKYLSDSGNTQPLKVIKVTKVTTQVVSGINTNIDFTVSSSNKDDKDIISCHSDIYEKPWEGLKEITVTCNDDEKNKPKYRKRRSTDQLIGGPMAHDIDDPKYKGLAEESLTKYLSDSGNTQPLKVIKVTKVTTQVVSGIKTKIDFTVSSSNKDDKDIISCHSDIYEKPWKGLKEITVNCNDDEKNKARSKRHATRFVGGPAVVNSDDPQYKTMAEESLKKFVADTGNTNALKLVKVTKVTTQVVAGSLTKIDFIVSSDQSGGIIQCNSEIWDRPWLSERNIKVNCNLPESRAKRSIIDKNGNDKSMRKSRKNVMGGAKTKDPTDKKYKLLAEESLRHYERKQGVGSNEVVDVKQVQTQLVSGMQYFINYIAKPVICNNCTDDDLLYCSARIWDRPWLSKKKITVSCFSPSDVDDDDDDEKETNGIKKLNNRNKRQIGNEIDEYIDEDLTQYYANRAVAQLNDQTLGRHLHKLVTIHAVQNTVQMKANMFRMYIEVAETFCLKRKDEAELSDCAEIDGLNHKLCLARLWPSPDDELVVVHISVICDDEEDFSSISGLYVGPLLRMSMLEYEKSPEVLYKTVHQGEPYLIPSFDTGAPIVLHFLLATTNCSKDLDPSVSPLVACYLDTKVSSKPCTSYIWLNPNSRSIQNITVNCQEVTSQVFRSKRSVSLSVNTTTDESEIQKLVTLSLQKLEMESLHRYKQRLLQVNSYSTKITSGKVTTIDFDIGYTSCLKYEWVENITSCEFIEHLPRRHCVSQIWERLWLNNGRNIDVKCQDDETPLEAHVEFQSAEMATQLANEALKHIEFKYPLPNKQKIVRIFSLEKQVIAGIHYRMKVEVGLTNCPALSDQTDCKLQDGVNKFCRINVWLRPWTDHPPNYRVSCDYQDTSLIDVYRKVQAQHLFHDFVTTYNPYYVNDHDGEMRRRFEIFSANVQKIHEFNIHEKGTARYGVTRFADLTYEEFAAKYTGLKPGLRAENQVPMRHAEIPRDPIPEQFDWRDHGAVTEVKDQGSCGSCWAFSVTGNIEGQWKLQSGQLVSLSEQELVDCDKLDNGCNGGLPDNAYRAIEQLGGLETETEYPYEGEDDKCAFNKTMSKVQITGAVNITSNETSMAKWLVAHGPISIGINANAMQFYMGGISHPWKLLCDPTNLDHGVLVVGYGVKDYPLFHKRLPYWIVKNSWGKTWGEQGYYRVYRGDGTCGVNQMASSAVV